MRNKSGFIGNAAAKFIAPTPVGTWILETESTNFDSDDFKKNIDRPGEFCKFLRENNLIGMKRIDVMKILGEPDRWDATWILYNEALGFICADGACAYLIEFESDRATGWCEVGLLGDVQSQVRSSAQLWHRQNVVFDRENWVPKTK